jgi:hypothetical protein
LYGSGDVVVQIDRCSHRSSVTHHDARTATS